MYIYEKEDLYGFRIVFQSKIIEGLNKIDPSSVWFFYSIIESYK
jgi:hypothetical protein